MDVEHSREQIVDDLVLVLLPSLPNLFNLDVGFAVRLGLSFLVALCVLRLSAFRPRTGGRSAVPRPQTP